MRRLLDFVNYMFDKSLNDQTMKTYFAIENLFSRGKESELFFKAVVYLQKDSEQL